MNYYPFHIGDYAVDTRHLSLLEDLAYRRLLDLYYTRNGLIPFDVADVARLVGMREHATEVESVLREFFAEIDGKWSHSRCDDEIGRMLDKQAKAQAAGRASANRRGTDVERTLNTRATDVEQASNVGATLVNLPTPTPTPTPTKEKTKPSVADDEKPSSGAKEKILFDFASHRFVGVNGSEDLWREAYPQVDVAAEITKAAAWLVANPAKAKKHYARFLNAWLARAQQSAPKPKQEKFL